MTEYDNLAKTLCGHSVNLKKGENVLLDMFETPPEMVQALIKEVRRRRANVFVNLNDERINAALNAAASDEELKARSAFEMFRMKNMDAYIAIRGSNNIYESSLISPKQMSKVQSALKAVCDWRVSKTKWVVLRWPTPAMAQQARMSTEQFADFYFKVCTFDYSKFDKPMLALKKLMEKTDKVRITGKNTDLTFSIKNIPAIPCGGQYNIPDGEVYTAPVKDSVNGTIFYTAPSIYQGTSFENVCLTFRGGKIVKATCSGDNKKLNSIFSCDEGASYVGEFALGVNPYIKKPMLDILFDEKISGSFHFTPGQAYEEADNGNRSKIHWDLVCIQTPEYGGGEIYFDNKLIRKNGLFVEKSLLGLNPDSLLKR